MFVRWRECDLEKVDGGAEGEDVWGEGEGCMGVVCVSLYA